MDESKLTALYYNPKIGLTSLPKFFEKVKKLGYNYDDVKEWYDQQQINQVYKTPKKDISTLKFSAPDIGYLYADLIDITNLGIKYHFLLCVIDLYSRYAWVFPLANKTPTSIEPYMKEVFDNVIKLYPKVSLHLTTDSGGEWMGIVDKLCNEYEVKRYWANPTDNTKGRTWVVESFNKVFLTLLKKALYAQNKINVNIIADLVENYNTSMHANLKYTPDQIFNQGKRYTVIKENFTPFKIGDWVRVKTKTDKFTKTGRAIRYSNDVYLITWRDGNRFRLRDSEFKALDKEYLPSQLLKVNPPLDDSELKGENYIKELAQAKEQKHFVKKQRESGINVDKEGKPVDVLEGKRKIKPLKRLDL